MLLNMGCGIQTIRSELYNFRPGNASGQRDDGDPGLWVIRRGTNMLFKF